MEGSRKEEDPSQIGRCGLIHGVRQAWRVQEEDPFYRWFGGSKRGGLKKRGRSFSNWSLWVDSWSPTSMEGPTRACHSDVFWRVVLKMEG